MTLLEERLRKRTTARLPFDSLAVVTRAGSGPCSDVIADAIGDDVAEMLRQLRLRVPRACFVRPYGESDMTAEEIGRDLNVRVVALCSVTTSATTTDVTMELIDVLREELIAQDRFLVSRRELIALERGMVRAVAAYCHADGTSARHPETESEVAYAKLIEARVRRAAGRIVEALAILREAGDADPRSNAIALELAATIIETPLVDRLPEARRATAEVLERGPSVRALHLQARLLGRFDVDWIGAEQSLRAALKMDQSSPSTHRMLGDLLLALGRGAEAAPHHRIVAEMMSLDERSVIAGAFEPYFGHQPRVAAARYSELSKRFPAANDFMVRAVLVDGDMLHARQSATTPFARALAASYCGQSARPEAFAPYDAALICAVGGRVDDAMSALERAAREYAGEVVFAGVEPLFAALAGQPRFEALISRLGLR
jgi:tetratricopeptide (TPR) repeat protein